MYELDAFEKHYIKGQGEVLFRDKFSLPKYFLPFVLLGMLAFGGFVIKPFEWLVGGLLTLFGLLFVTLGNLAMSGYRLIVSDAGLQAYVGISSRTIPFDRIECMELAEASLATYPLGKNIVRRGAGGIGYIPGFGTHRGVRLHIKNQTTHIFVASTRPEELIAALRKGIARSQSESSNTMLDFESDEQEITIEKDVEINATIPQTKSSRNH